jgi:hypothetical protein
MKQAKKAFAMMSYGLTKSQIRKGKEIIQVDQKEIWIR